MSKELPVTRNTPTRYMMGPRSWPRAVEIDIGEACDGSDVFINVAGVSATPAEARLIARAILRLADHAERRTK